jgi:CubicO group peptidase (beta-lactamase class C family)
MKRVARFSRQACGALFVCALGCRATAQTGSPAAPLEPGARMPSDSTVIQGAAGARIDDYLTRAAAFGFSGAVLVADSTKVLLAKGYGFADEVKGRVNDTRTVFDIGSITKPFTTTAILTLAAEGRLSVHDSLHRFFPNVPPDKRGITLHHLMTHTSGLADPPIGDYAPVSTDSLVRAVFAGRLAAPIGTRYIYSNHGVSLLALVVGMVTGRGYEEFLRERLLKPGGLLETGYNLPDLDAPRVAHTYNPPVDRGSPLDRLRASQGPRAMLLGNGGMLSTVWDLYRWELALRGGGAIPQRAIDDQFRVQFERNARTAVGYDWEIERDSTGRVLSYSHGSDAPSEGLNGEFHRYQPERSLIVLMSNNRWNGASSRNAVVPNIRRLMRDSTVPLPPRVWPAPAAQLKAFSGLFAMDDGSRIALRPLQDRLEMSVTGHGAVDVFNARQGDTAVSTARSYSQRADSLMREWREMLLTRDPVIESSVLGTFRLDRRAYLTTVRFVFPRDTVVARFEWSGTQPVTHSGDFYQPVLVGPLRVSPVPAAVVWPSWWVQGDELVSFDVVSGTRMSARLLPRDEAGRRTLIIEGNGRALRAREVARP